MITLQAEVTFIDQTHGTLQYNTAQSKADKIGMWANGIAVLVFTESGNTIMLPLDLLPEDLQPGQVLTVMIGAGK